MTYSAASIVAALALIAQRLSELASALRQNAAVCSVTFAVAPRRYADGDRVECYVDAELVTGDAVGYWLEFRCVSGSWIIESSIRHNTEEGENELFGLPTRYAVDDEELVGELAGASAALVAAAERVDVANL